MTPEEREEIDRANAWLERELDACAARAAAGETRALVALLVFVLMCCGVLTGWLP